MTEKIYSTLIKYKWFDVVDLWLCEFWWWGAIIVATAGFFAGWTVAAFLYN